jgi:protein-disulfide isomerase
MSVAEVVRLKSSVTERDHTNGPENAPVTLLEYGNFECIDCGAVFPTIKQVQRFLGDNLRFIFRHFPSVKTHPHAMRAAEAAEAAGAQGKFWEMHDELFRHQRSLEDQHLLRYARRIGLDMQRFSSDLMENAFLAQIEREYQSALFDEHITGTPTLYINEVRYTGSTDLEGMLTAIREADSSGRIILPETARGFRRVLRALHRQAGS